MPMSKQKTAFFLVLLLLALGILFFGNRTLQEESLTIKGQDGGILVKLVFERKGKVKGEREEKTKDKNTLGGNQIEIEIEIEIETETEAEEKKDEKK